MVESFNYQFLAMRGIQAGREYYVAMCPLRHIPRMFLFNEEEIPAELRAQRILNKARVPEITRYLLSNPTDYVFSAITASIDGGVEFAPIAQQGYGRNAGVLTVPMNSKFLINDGQHRRAAIEEALKSNPRLGDETISVVLFIDAGLERSQQLFADLNTHAVRPTRSIGILYDHRDPMAQLALKLVQNVPIFKGLTETERTTISNRSIKLFTLSGIYLATQALLGKKTNAVAEKNNTVCAQDYWSYLSDLIPEWRLVVKKQVNAADLRRDYIHCHGVTLHALGVIGHSVIGRTKSDWQRALKPLAKIDWHRTNTQWEGRAMLHGHMNKSGDSVALTANAIKIEIGLPLTPEESQLEATVSKAGMGRK